MYIYCMYYRFICQQKNKEAPVGWALNVTIPQNAILERVLMVKQKGTTCGQVKGTHLVAEKFAEKLLVVIPGPQVVTR